MVDHVSVAVRDLGAAADFYEAVLGTLGFAKLDGRAATVGFGKRYSEFWINHRPARAAGGDDTGVHVALRASTVMATFPNVGTLRFAHPTD